MLVARTGRYAQLNPTGNELEYQAATLYHRTKKVYFSLCIYLLSHLVYSSPNWKSLNLRETCVSKPIMCLEGGGGGGTAIYANTRDSQRSSRERPCPRAPHTSSPAIRMTGVCRLVVLHGFPIVLFATFCSFAIYSYTLFKFLSTKIVVSLRHAIIRYQASRYNFVILFFAFYFSCNCLLDFPLLTGIFDY